MTPDAEFFSDLLDNDLAYRLLRLSHRNKGDDRLIIQEAARRLLAAMTAARIDALDAEALLETLETSP